MVLVWQITDDLPNSPNFPLRQIFLLYGNMQKFSGFTRLLKFVHYAIWEEFHRASGEFVGSLWEDSLG